MRTGAALAGKDAVFAAAVLIALSATALAQQRAEPGFTAAATARLIQAYERRFGSQARSRIEGWKRFALERRNDAARELALIESTNRFLNRLRFVDDQTHWGEADYWATPAESVGSGGADCEDYAIAKYYFLKELGVPVARLRPAYLKLSGLHTAALRSDPGTRFFVDALLRAARHLEVPVIAQNVEISAILPELAVLGFAGYQGYAAGAPAPWPPPSPG